jgi:hypothetical protein
VRDPSPSYLLCASPIRLSKFSHRRPHRCSHTCPGLPKFQETSQRQKQSRNLSTFLVSGIPGTTFHVSRPEAKKFTLFHGQRDELRSFSENAHVQKFPLSILNSQPQSQTEAQVPTRKSPSLLRRHKVQFHLVRTGQQIHDPDRQRATLS